MYRPRFLGLDEAAYLIARLLRTARPNDYPDACSALDEGRRELVQALFDGTVRSQGVLYELPPLPPPDQDGPFPIPSPDKWLPIEAGWWSNCRYEKLIWGKPDNTEDFGIERELQASPPEVASGAAVAEDEDSSLHEDTASSNLPVKYQIDKGVINWSNDAFEIDENYDTDWEYGRIRLHRGDVNVIFGVQAVGSPDTLPDQATIPRNDSQRKAEPLCDKELKATEHEVVLSGSASQRRRGRPPDARRAMHEWLDGQLAKYEPRLLSKPDTELAHMYCDEELHMRDAERLRKGVDAQRKHVRTWRQGRDQQG